MTDKITRFPIKAWQRTANRRGRLSVSCVVSDRWLRFAPTSAHMDLGSVVWVDVMTDVSGKEQKLCTLGITIEELGGVLDRIEKEAD